MGPAVTDRLTGGSQGFTVVDHLVDGLAWREAGSGPAVVFLHGLGLTRTGWEPQLRDLGRDHRCVAWDMPGYGESHAMSQMSFEAISDEVVRLLDLIGVRRADLVGLSFGGMHALHTALHHPGRVRRMVVAGTSPAFGLDGTDPHEWRLARLARIDAGETPADIATDVLASVAGPGLDPNVLADLAASFARIPADGLRSACELLTRHDLRGDLGAIGAPTLVVVGEHDIETPIRYAEALVAGIPSARLAVMDGVGHLAPSEAPVRFNRLVRDFLDEGRES